MGFLGKLFGSDSQAIENELIQKAKGYEIEKLRSHIIYFQKMAIQVEHGSDNDQSVRNEAKKDQLLASEILKTITDHKFSTADDYRRIYSNELAKLTKKYGVNSL